VKPDTPYFEEALMRIPSAAALLALPLLIAASPAVQAQDLTEATVLSTAQRALHTQALQSFRQQRYAGAFGRFARLADAGHVPSAQLALVMHANGPLLFGSDWSATPGQLQRWNALVINGARKRAVFDDNERGD
jgi:hypothetical protein